MAADPGREHQAAQHDERRDLGEVGGGNVADAAVAREPFVDDAGGIGGVLDERHHGTQVGEVPRPAAVVEVDDGDLAVVHHEVRHPQVGVDEPEALGAHAVVGEAFDDLAFGLFDDGGVRGRQSRRVPPVTPAPGRAEHGVEVPPEPREGLGSLTVLDVLVQRRGDGAQFAEADVGGVILGDGAFHESEQVDEVGLIADAGLHDAPAVGSGYHLRRRDGGVAAEAFHPVEFGFDGGQRVVARPVHAQDLAPGLRFHQERAVLRVAQQRHSRRIESIVGERGVREAFVVGGGHVAHCGSPELAVWARSLFGLVSCSALWLESEPKPKIGNDGFTGRKYGAVAADSTGSMQVVRVLTMSERSGTNSPVPMAWGSIGPSDS